MFAGERFFFFLVCYEKHEEETRSGPQTGPFLWMHLQLGSKIRQTPGKQKGCGQETCECGGGMRVMTVAERGG